MEQELFYTFGPKIRFVDDQEQAIQATLEKNKEFNFSTQAIIEEN